MDLSTFCSLADQLPSTVSEICNDLSLLYDYYGLTSANFMSSDVVRQHLSDRIKSSFKSPPEDIRRTCKRLQRELIFQEVLEEKEIDRYYAIANSIRDHVREVPEIVPEKDDWETAIVSAVDFITLQAWDTSLKADFRDYAIANAVKTLRSYGYDVQLKELQPLVANADWELLVTRLHDLASQLGGINIVRQMFNHLKPVYDHVQRRYHLVRRPNSWGGNTEPAVPWGYLYQLAGKYPLPLSSFNNFASLWSELITLTTNFSALYDVQPYNHFELMFQSPCVILMEVKKKPFTRLARSGNDVKILLDLSESILEAQRQAGRTELLLREKGIISLKDPLDNGVSEIVLGEREIERISITLLDYGSFQDRTVIKQFLDICLQANFTSRDAAHKKKFDKLLLKLEELRSQVESLSNFANSDREQPFFHCAFISVPQFLVMLDDVSSNEDFKEILWKTRHTSTGSLDFYFDYSYISKLRDTKPK